MDLLHRLQEMFAIDYAGGRLIVTHLTHEQISAMTGTSRVTVTRAMRSLRDQNQIDIIDGHILVKASRASLNLTSQNSRGVYPRITDCPQRCP